MRHLILTKKVLNFSSSSNSIILVFVFIHFQGLYRPLLSHLFTDWPEIWKRRIPPVNMEFSPGCVKKCWIWIFNQNCFKSDFVLAQEFLAFFHLVFTRSPIQGVLIKQWIYKWLDLSSIDISTIRNNLTRAYKYVQYFRIHN